MMPEMISAISGGNSEAFMKPPPVEMCEMKIAEKIAAIGSDEASSATEMPSKPSDGSAVESPGIHCAAPDR